MHPRLVPLLAVLAPAPQVWHRVHAPHLQPHEDAHGETRSETDVESAVAVEVRRVRAVELQPLAVRDEHGHPGAVLARVEDLRGLVARGVEVDLRRLEDARLAGLEVVPEDRRRILERGEGVEHLVVLPLTADRGDRPQGGQVEALPEPPVQGEQAELGVGVVQVVGDERVVDDLHRLQNVVALRDDLAPPGPLGVPRVDRDHPLAGRIEVREEVEQRTVVADEPVARVEVVEQPNDLARHPRMLRVFEIEIVDTVAPVGAEPHV